MNAMTASSDSPPPRRAGDDPRADYRSVRRIYYTPHGPAPHEEEASVTIWSRRNMGLLVVGMGALTAGWWLLSVPLGPTIKILSVDVVSTDRPSGTHLNVATKYENTGCGQILLARFLINTRPTPSIALPQKYGPTVLPASEREIVEEVDLDFPLGAGMWHLFTNVVCYIDGAPVPATVVTPTALFAQK